MLHLQTYLHRHLVRMRLDAKCSEAAERLCRRGVGCALVEDSNGHLVGIVTDRDLSCIALGRQRSPDMPLSEAMTPSPVCAETDSDIENVVHLMEESGVRRIPIVERLANGENRCVGLVTLDDLIASKMIDWDHASRIVRAQIRRKALRALDRHPRWEFRPEPSSSLNHFYGVVEAETKIAPQLLLPATNALLDTLVRSTHYSAAARLIACLPEGLRELAGAFPAGPEPGLSLASAAERLSRELGIEETQARALFSSFATALTRLLPEKEIDDLRASLAPEFSRLFGEVRKAA